MSAVRYRAVDIAGKALALPAAPAARRPRARSRAGLRHASGADIDEVVGAAAHYVELGYQAIRAQAGVPGLAATYGVGRRAVLRAGRARTSAREPVEHEKYLISVPRLFERLRSELGPTFTCSTMPTTA